MLMTTGRTLSGFTAFMLEAAKAHSVKVDARNQKAVHHAIHKIDDALRKLPYWRGWFRGEDFSDVKSALKSKRIELSKLLETKNQKTA